MKQWLRENLAILLMNGVFLALFGMAGYIWQQNNLNIQQQFNDQQQSLSEEILERKAENERLELMIEAKVGRAEFNEFKVSVYDMKSDVKEIRQDIKELLKK